MEQFDKWYEKEVGPIDFPGIKEFYEARKKTWRAALKWVKAMHDVSSEPRFSINITEELGD